MPTIRYSMFISIIPNDYAVLSVPRSIINSRENKGSEILYHIPEPTKITEMEAGFKLDSI